MKKMDDAELQKLMEEHRLSSVPKTGGLTGDDAKAYQVLFDALDTDPLQGLPYDFSAKVTRKVQAETKRNSELKFYLFSLGVCVAIIAVIYGLTTIMKPAAVTTYLGLLIQYKWALILIAFSFLTIQYLDQVLVKANIFRGQHK